MLRVVEDDPESRQLVLRAAPWTALDIARRLGLTALLLGCVAGSVVGVAHLSPGGIGLAVLLTYLASIFARLIVEEVAELVLDGASRSLRVRRRGRHIWRTIEVGHRLEDDALLRLRAGLVANHGFRRPELGIDLHEGRRDGGPLRLLAPTFAVEGIDRRDEARALAETIARRLGLGLAVEQDDALLYQARISSRDPPPAELTGYRQLPRTAGLARDARPSFEPPRDPPALDLAAAAADLQLHLVRDDRGELVAAPRSIPWKRWSLLSLKVLLVFTIGGAAVAWLADADPLVGAILGLLAPVLGALCGLAILALAVLLLAAFKLLHDLVLGLLASERDSKPRWYNTLPLARWRLGAGVLSGPLGPLVWRRDDVLAVVVVDHWERPRSTSPPDERLRRTSLCIRSRRGWVRLARTAVRQDDPTNRREVPPSVVALALEVARTLDVPLRGSP